MKRAVRRRQLYAWGGLVVGWAILALWIRNPLYLPGPWETIKALGTILSRRESYGFLAFSTGRVVLGMGCALAVGVPLGFGTGFSPRWRELLRPLRSVLKSVPVVSFIMLAILWLPTSLLPALISFLVAMPLLWTATEASVLAADPGMVEMLEVFRVPFGKQFRAYHWPWAKSYIKTGLKQSVGLAWRAGMAAEALSFAPRSLGRKMVESKTYLETADLFAWTVLVILLSYVMERMVCREAETREL